jgi:hypothetical protein
MTLSRISVRRARIETLECLNLDLFLGGNERDDEVRPMMTRYLDRPIFGKRAWVMCGPIPELPPVMRRWIIWGVRDRSMAGYERLWCIVGKPLWGSRTRCFDVRYREIKMRSLTRFNTGLKPYIHVLLNDSNI